MLAEIPKSITISGNKDTVQQLLNAKAILQQYVRTWYHEDEEY